MKFILIGNYLPDGQESMIRYTENLRESLILSGHSAEIWVPTVFFGTGQKSTASGLGKWLGYLDKWLLYPFLLRFRILSNTNKSRQDTFFHICDHSNSPYLSSLPLYRKGITCHDVLAIRGAFGFKDAYCDATMMGKILQNRIFKHLRQSKILTTVSQLTMNQLIELCKGDLPEDRNWKVIHNSFNADFHPMSVAESSVLTVKAGIPAQTPFMLTIGSGLVRKNRKMLLDMAVELGAKWDGLICFAGQPLDDEFRTYIVQLGLKDRVVSIENPDHQTLLALYSACQAFIFPSFSEGFGWPLIEAQACGAPVIASNIEPMPEVSNGSAIHADPYKAPEFAAAFLHLLNEENRNELIKKGYENAKRFDRTAITKEFIQLYTNQSNG